MSNALTTTQDEAIKERILHLEDRRCDAQIKGDIAALEALFSEDLVYTHASGRVEGKDAYLAPRRSGSIKYTKFEHEDLRVRVYHALVAILTGRIRTWVSVDGAAKMVDHRFTSVWVRPNTGTNDWNFVTYASSAVPSPTRE
jgi:hypothetical protein